MSINLNKVFDLKHNVFIEACAGAGKTWLLSKRYVAIMDDFAKRHHDHPDKPSWDASNILVITFTKKAQAEMASRIYKDLNQVLNGKGLEHVTEGFGTNLMHADEAYKMHVRSTFTQNAISTIDSFCTQILRDQSDRVGLDPEFRIQDEVDTKMIEMETLERFLRTESENHNPDMKLLLNHLSVHQLRNYLGKLSENYQLLSAWIDHHAETSTEVLIDEFKESNPLPACMEGLEDRLKTLVTDLPSQERMVDPQNPQYRSMVSLVGHLNVNDLDDPYIYGLGLLEYVKQICLTGDQSAYYKKPQIKRTVWSESDIPSMRDKQQILLDYAKEYLPVETLMIHTPNKWDIIACEVNHHLAAFFKGYQKTLERRFRNEGILSFSEVIIRTHALLNGNPDLCSYYGEKYPHILFDEFQDTNDLRWNIIRLIAQDGTENLRPGGLFLVGDTKQSIYRFNQADVQVMNRVRKLIQGNGGNVELADETYRSSREYVENIINPLMESTFPAEEDEFELYETYFKRTVIPTHSLLSQEQHDLAHARISLVVNDRPEARAKADIIKTAHAAKKWMSWLDDHEIKTEDGPDVGILLRSFTNIIEYIRVFTEQGLDFEVLSGKGLFEEQESFDVYNLISVLINPLDDFALVGVLRSPFFIFKDAEIQKLRDAIDHKSRTGWAWEALQKERNDIADKILSWQEICAHEPIDRLLTSIVLEGDRQLGWISETGGALRLANIHLLIQKIHQLSLDGLGLREVHEYLKFQIQHGDASQSELPGARRIQILTIHKAKGLQFPVVILPELHRTSPSDKSGLALGREGSQWNVGIQVAALDGNHKTSTYSRLHEQNRLEELAEDKRLFYVALTRAKFGLEFIISATTEREVSAPSWWKRYLHQHFAPAFSKNDLSGDLGTFQTVWESNSTSYIKYDVSLASDLLETEERQFKQLAEVDHPEIIPIPPFEYAEISPHTIMEWMGDATTVHDEPKIGQDRGDEFAARKFGTLLHQVMEMEWFDIAAHDQDIRHSLEDLEVASHEHDTFMEELSECMSVYLKSELANRLKGFPESSKLRELPLHAFLKDERRIFKVSGIIDLLYHDGQEWIVLDYKSDMDVPTESTLVKHPYWFQIQTYLWMINLMFGIQARGQLYFSRHDKTLEIQFEEEKYFKALHRVQPGLRPAFLSRTTLSKDLAALLREISTDGSVFLVEPTKTNCENLIQALAAEGLLHPRLRVMTLSDLRKSLEPVGRRLTPYLTRLGVAAISGRNAQWGEVNRRAKAFYRAIGGEALNASSMRPYKEFLQWCDRNDLVIPGKIWDNSRLPDDAIIIIDGIHSTVPGDYEFLTQLSAESPLHFINPLGKSRIHSGFEMEMKDWSRQHEMPADTQGHSVISCFSVIEEVQYHGQRIRELVQAGEDVSDIMVAVPSMERYVPIIKRVFSQLEIPVRLSKREPVMERPVVQLALTIIKGMMQHRLTWDMVASVWLHPLVSPPSRTSGLRQRVDVEIRRSGILFYDDAVESILKQDHYIRIATELKQFVNRTWGKRIERYMSAQVKWLSDTLTSFKSIKELKSGSVASKAYNSLTRALSAIENDWERYLGAQADLADLHRELRERLKSVEVSSSSQGFGVDVISLLDTLTLDNKYLMVMGLNEGQFPLTPNTNPYLAKSDFNPWYMNLTLFKIWLARIRGRLILTSPQRDAEGKHLQTSTFCEYLKREPAPSSSGLSPYEQFVAASGKAYADPQVEYKIRHNELLTRVGLENWSGKLDTKEHVDAHTISATAFDDLIKCPQRFWFGRMLGLERAESNIEARDETWVGNLIHEILERFGLEDGFKIAAADLKAAYNKLGSVISDLLREKDINPDDRLLDNVRTRLLLKNHKDKEKNLLAAMLGFEAEVLKEYEEEQYFEKEFGDASGSDSWPAYMMETEDLKLKLHGKIDRVLVSKNDVWATDYKTGRADLSDTKYFWTSQMLFYYLILRNQYPDKNIILSYEQLKSMRKKEHGLKAILGDTKSDNPVLSLKDMGSRLLIEDGGEWSINRIMEETFFHAQRLADRNFPLTEREEKRACEYCEYDRICRKTSLPR